MSAEIANNEVPAQPQNEAVVSESSAFSHAPEEEILHTVGDTIPAYGNMKVVGHTKRNNTVYAILEQGNVRRAVPQDDIINASLSGHPEELEQNIDRNSDSHEAPLIDSEQVAQVGSIAISSLDPELSKRRKKPSMPSAASSGGAGSTTRPATPPSGGGTAPPSGPPPSGPGGAGSGSFNFSASWGKTNSEIQALQKGAEISHVRWPDVQNALSMGIEKPIEYILRARGTEKEKTMHMLGFNFTPPEDTGRKPHDLDTVYEDPDAAYNKQGENARKAVKEIVQKIESKKEATTLRWDLDKKRPGALPLRMHKIVTTTPGRMLLAWKIAKNERDHIRHKIHDSTEDYHNQKLREKINSASDSGNPLSISEIKNEILLKRKAAEKELGIRLEVEQDQGFFGIFRHVYHTLGEVDDSVRGARAALRGVMRKELKGGSGSASIRHNLAEKTYRIDRKLNAIKLLELDPHDTYDMNAANKASKKYEHSSNSEIRDAERKEYNEIIRVPEPDRTPMQRQRLREIFDGNKKNAQAAQPIWKKIFRKNQPWP